MTGKAGPTILLVEDDEDTRGAIAELLEDSGYQVAPTSNGREACSYLQRQPRPDCMVLDLWMPMMDGWALATEVKEGRLPDVPMVVITAAEPYWGYPVASRFVLRKPLDSAKLLGMVGSLVPSA
jgi:two-component system, OmpR family, response regulator